MTGRSLLAGSLVAALTAALVACSGGGNSADPVGTAPPPNVPPTGDTGCTGSCVTATSFLTTAEVGTILSQAIAEAQAQNQPATIAVVDRVGNPLGVYRMAGARPTVTVTSNRGVSGGLENVAVPSELAAISKAVTGAYLSSEGNAFSTRTASQIVQEHFNPGEANSPSGPLFGVQFSQLVCSDLITLPVPALDILMTPGARTTGPKPAPLGLSADPGGLPLYKAGTVVGGIGVVANDTYTLDPRVIDRDRDVDELIATAGTFNFSAPLDRRGDRITADGKTFRFSDVDFSDLARTPGGAPAFASLPASTGGLMDVPFFFVAANGLRAGTVFTSPESGIRADTGTFQPQDAFILVDGNNQNRYPPRAGTDGAGALTAAEVTEVLRQALIVANRERAQIRRPTNSQVRVTISVVDTNGAILGVVRTRDAPVFGTDVSLQKARTAAFFSGAYAADDLRALPPAAYANGTRIAFASYVTASQAFFGIPTIFDDGQYAFTPRAIGNIARPFYPDGVEGTQNGPLSKPFDAWSPFTDGLQLDLVYNAALSTVAGYVGLRDGTLTLAQALDRIPLGNPANTATRGCVGFNADNTTAPSPVTRINNGIQIFPGASPIYRGGQLVGGVGISGDGIDQDDSISFLGLYNAAQILGSINHAPNERRSDRLVPQGARLRYVQCPQAPFLNSTEQNVCEGI
jgi:uncharacterized protein GlcG (DUF336 family)